MGKNVREEGGREKERAGMDEEWKAHVLVIVQGRSHVQWATERT